MNRQRTPESLQLTERSDIQPLQGWGFGATSTQGGASLTLGFDMEPRWGSRSKPRQNPAGRSPTSATSLPGPPSARWSACRGQERPRAGRSTVSAGRSPTSTSTSTASGFAHGREAVPAEEPYERIVHVRICGGVGYNLGGNSRGRPAVLDLHLAQGLEALSRRCSKPDPKSNAG
jgi:hypothetical protein